MKNKITSVTTLVAFFFFYVCCAPHSVKKVNIKTASDSKKRHMKIIGVQTTSGEYFQFSEKEPAGIFYNEIKGYASIEKILEFNLSDVQRLHQDERKKIFEITTKDGKTYEALTYQKDEDKIIVTKLKELVSIPLDQTEMVWVYKTSALPGILMVAIPVALVVAIVSASSPTPRPTYGQCCPFIYSFDGEKYMFDAEPYGGAICQGLERTEWCALESLKETDGQYKIRIANELEETQQTNEMALLVVDHPNDMVVAPDASGKIHTIVQPVVPDRVFDNKGNDLMPYFIKNDRVFWTSRIEGRDLDKKEDLRDELIFEFPKPQDAKKAKLLVNACTTYWGSHVIKQYLDLYGDSVHDWYNSIKTHGLEYYRFLNMHLKDELYALCLRVQTEKGWMSKGFIRGGGPLISENKVYPLDISDVLGDVLRIKLTPPVNFWMINYLAVDYSDDFPIMVKVIKPAKASDNNGFDIRSAIVSDDNIYHMMPGVGDQAELIFEAPPQANSMQRSLILKIKGYYDIHLEAKGEPQFTMIERLQKEPGFLVQHAFKEYLKWKDDVMSRFLSR